MTYQDIVNIIRNAAAYVNPNGFFIHGRKTDGSLNYNEATPQILLLEPQPNTTNNNSSFIETITFPIVFVTQDSPESTELTREDLKQEMYLLSRKLLAKIDEEPLLQNVNYTGGQPEIRQLSATLTGFSYSIQITYPLSECNLDFDLPPSIKLFATQTTVASGATVQIGWIADNVNSVNITPFGVLQGQFGFVNTVVNATTTFNGLATNDNGTATDSITISVSNGCDDATAELFDTNGNLLSTTPIASGATEPIIAPDATILINGDNSFPTIPSGGLENIVVENTAGTSVGAYDGNTNSWVTPDITVTDSDGSTFTQPSVTNVVCTPVMPLAVDFSVDDATPDTNQTIAFTDLTVGASSWVWNFGDGTTSTLQNPTKSYRYAGTYTVTLAAENGGSGGIETKVGFIVVTLQALNTTNLLAGYDAPIGATPPNLTLVSGAVSQWNDVLATHDITQGTPANRPLYNATGYTAPDGTVYGTVLFDGLNDVLFNTILPRTSTGVMYMVFRHVNIASGNTIMLAAPSAIGHNVQNQSDNPAYRMQNGVVRDTKVGYVLGQWLLAKFQFSNAGSAEIRINDFPSFPIANTGANAPTGFSLGANSTGTAASNIEVLQLDIFSAIPTLAVDNERVQFYDSKFGICN